MTNSKKNYLSLKDFMKFASDFEQESAVFYHNMQNLELEKSVRQLAELLEKQELSHKQIIEDFDLSGSKGYIQFAPDYSLILPVLLTKNPSLEELIEVGLEREIKSKEIYENALQFTSGDMKGLLEGLARFEEEHVNRLNSLKDNL